ncbi:hypothetical protein M0R04_09845 [Candidatus Dojkabacteria bacterium]|jgi:hypothetical protein|nr:hypothetical protein [Candidatus Dojkabacteria bacterium]
MKKGAAGLVIGVGIAVLLLIGIIALIVVLNQKGFFSPKKQEVDSVRMFVMPVDADSKNATEANYQIEYTNVKNERVVVSSGKLAASWNEVVVPKDFMLLVTCWSSDHYLVKAYKQHSPAEITENKSLFRCEMVKMANVTVSHQGDFKRTTSGILLNVTADKWMYKTSFCFAWTSGIDDVSLRNQYNICEKGVWKNYTSFDVEKKTYNYLPNNTYLCGDNQATDSFIEICEQVENTHCKVFNEPIPERFMGLVDSCVSTGNTIHNETRQFEILVKSSEYKNILDAVDIYVYDKERRFDEATQSYKWNSELNKQDMGIPDIVYRIPYE